MNNQENTSHIEQIYSEAAYMLIDQKMSALRVIDELVMRGLDRDAAKMVVDSINSQLRESKRDSAGKDLAFGSLWLIGGIVVTAVTYSAASDGGYYVITWGAIVYGAVRLIKGLAALA